MIEWKKRCKRDKTQLADRRTWSSACGHYKIEECDIRYGKRHDKRGNYLGYPIFYRAMVLVDGTWQILSAHRKRGPAIKQCEYWHENGRRMPRKAKARKRK